jgi:predicted NBD/HSP70 family sugar kinase
VSAIVRPDDVRRQNQFSVLKALRRHGNLSRTELSAATGLSASTVTVITNSLIDRHVLAVEQDSEATAQRRGRPQVRLLPNPDFASVAVFRLALNAIYVSLNDYSGNQVGARAIRPATRGMTSEQLIAAMGDSLEILIAGLGGLHGPLSRICIGAEGIVDAVGEVLLSSPAIDARATALGPGLSKRFDVPVVVSNECNMIAEALHWKSPDRYGRNFAAVLLSDGVGMGLYLNNRLFSGIRSSAVEFGHICHQPEGALCRCGRRGCIEAYAGRYAIWRSAIGADPNRLLDEELDETCLDVLIERAKSGDENTLSAFREAGKAIGTGLSNLFTMFDAIPLVFTGPGVKAIDYMRDSISEALDSPCFGLPVTVSVLDEDPDHVSLIKTGCLMSGLTFLDANVPPLAEGAARAVTG